MSGRDRGAGIAQADQWTASSDPFLRRMAIYVYLDIRDEQSKRKVRQLAKDPDPAVSGLAKVWLEARP